MLLEYGVRNFFSFKEGAVVSLRFDGNTPEEISQGRSCATIMGVNGANAAGKTQLLKALDFVVWFACRSFSWKPGADMPFEPHGESKEESDFFVEFDIDGIVYRYEFTAIVGKVLREALYRTKSKKTLLFERVENRIENATNEFEALRSLTLRDNVSVISTANQYQLLILEDVFSFFNNIITNVYYAGLYEPSGDYNSISAFLFNVPVILKFLTNFIKSCDTGVEEIVIRQREGQKGEAVFYPVFVHRIAGADYDVSVYEESSGTKRLFKTLADYFIALDRGSVLVTDEFDLHLHPFILPKLLDLFTDPDKNKKNAQLIFTSHNSRIMNTLGRYRSCIAVKRDNESFVFRLDEVSGDLLRNDRPISPVYEDGKIGGVPRI